MTDVFEKAHNLNPGLASDAGQDPDGDNLTNLDEFNDRTNPKNADSDGDGLPDDEDACPVSDLSETVVIDGCDSGVTNHLATNGCTISDDIAECAANAGNHGMFISCVTRTTQLLLKAGVISGNEKDAIQRCAAESDIP